METALIISFSLPIGENPSIQHYIITLACISMAILSIPLSLHVSTERIFVGRSHVERVAEARLEHINRYCQVSCGAFQH